ADRDAALVLHHLDLYVVGIAALGALRRGDLGLAAAPCDRPHVAVHALDLDLLACRDLSLPVEVALRGKRGRGGRDEAQQHESVVHGHFSLSRPGRQSLMSPLKDSSSSRALPEPIVKLKRCFVLPVSVTGKHASKSPSKVETDTATLAVSGIAMSRSPSCVAKR